MAAFVGRETELAQLHRYLDEADRGKGRVIFITGDAGAGKSTLTSQFLERAATLAPSFRILRAGCSEQYGAGEPYQPFVEAFRSLVQTGPETGGSRWRSFRDLAAQVAPHWLGAIPVAGNVISATISTAAEIRKGSGAPSEESLFFQYTELFLAAAADAPLLLFIDDLHWADRATVSLLAHLARRIGTERVLMVGTYRAADVDVAKHPIREARLELERYGVAAEMALDPLPTDALRALITSELQAPPAPELLAWLQQHAGTNPLFFLELLRWLVDRGFARERFGTWELGNVPESVEVPRSAAGAIERRLERLDPDVLRILEYASVEGNEFGSTTLALLLDMDELQLEDAIDPLVRVHRLVQPVDTREMPNGELASIYRFAHSLIREVLHGGLQGKRRILLHRRMAEILEQVHAGATHAIAHRLALHFDEGRQPARAYEFALIGAEQAGAVFAHQAAIELIRRALRNAQDDAARAVALERLGDSLRLAGRHVESLEALGDALALHPPHDASAIRVRRMIIDVEGTHGSRPRADLEARLLELIEDCRRADARVELCEAVWLLNGLHGTASDEAAMQRARDALDVCEQLGEPALLGKAHYNLGRILVFAGETADAVPHLRAALDIFERDDNRYAAGNCRNLLGVLLTLGGDYDGGATEFNAAATIFDAIADPASEAHVRSNLGALLTRLGRFEEAESNLHEAIRLNLRMDASAWLLTPLENKARLRQASAGPQIALAEWQRLLEHATATGYPDFAVVAHAGAGTCHLELGDIDAAAAAARAAAAGLADDAGWSDGRTDYTLLAARLAAHKGDVESADSLLSSAEEALASRDRYLWAVARLQHGELLMESAGERARTMIREALETFAGMGATPLVRRAAHCLEAMEVPR